MVVIEARRFLTFELLGVQDQFLRSAYDSLQRLKTTPSKKSGFLITSICFMSMRQWENLEAHGCTPILFKYFANTRTRFAVTRLELLCAWLHFGTAQQYSYSSDTDLHRYRGKWPRLDNFTIGTGTPIKAKMSPAAYGYSVQPYYMKLLAMVLLMLLEPVLDLTPNASAVALVPNFLRLLLVFLLIE